MVKILKTPFSGMKMINWKKTPAAIYRAKHNKLKPVSEIDPISLDDLINIDKQKEMLFHNTEKFVNNKPASHALIWGSRGTGKSSLVKALLNYFFKDDLRVIEFFKDDLDDIIDVCDEIRDLNYKFIIFCDDLSFEVDDSSYKSVKTIIEGSIEVPPKNVLFYATSNRRHMIPEFFTDNEGTKIKNNEIHYSENIEEKIALADRFGLWIPFYQGNLDDYLKILDSYFPSLDDEKRSLLHEEGKKFATARSSKSGRTAKQFFTLFNDMFNKY
jgi:predicted AAA+ superfamily ATPase